MNDEQRRAMYASQKGMTYQGFTSHMTQEKEGRGAPFKREEIHSFKPDKDKRGLFGDSW